MIYRFADFELREEDFCLVREGARVALEPKNLRVLLQLVSHAGRCVQKNTLLDTVWADTFVEENTLTRAIAVLRRVLGDSAQDPRFIETIPTRGYRFIAPVEALPETPPVVPAPKNAPQESFVAASQERLPARSLLPAVAVLALCLVVIGTTSVLLWHRHKTIATVRRGPISIAVLPILNQTGDPSLDYVSDGTTQSVIQDLAGVLGLRVIGSTTAFRFRNTPQDAQSIGHNLGVDAVLQGRLQRNQDKLVLNVELTQTNNNSILLSHQYLSDTPDLRRVQADILHDTLQALSFDTGKLNGQSPLGQHTNSPAAYEENLRGEALTRTDSPQAFREAVQHFQKATRLDPNYDRAWSDLAQAHLFLGIYYESPLDHMPIARTAALRALQLNPALPEAHGSLGVVDLLYDWDYASAASELEKEGAMRSAMSMLACTAHLREQSGHPQRAEEEVRRLLAYDPQSEMLVSELGCAAYYERHYDDAVRSYSSAMELDPGSPLPYLGIGRSLTQLGKYKEAVDVLDSFSKRNGFAPPILLAESGYTCALSGDRKGAMQRMESLEDQARSAYVDPYLIALIYHGLHDHTATIDWLQKAAAVHSSLLFSVLSDPMWQDSQQDPQLIAIVDKMESKAD
ncbi:MULTISPECIES: winged helix-turn-helix domain-containing protein [Acidobacteriaceae]|uniref:winged helix-turn-helix domain-containing protein n=1 Tax=Acidobacteriaceae TaxID=204434 RepID=UPI00131E4E13|nr:MULTISPECIES: winged helix-turn-helix domain-containing protein [Acidobacteriaceae]MDW5267590.1 winged helix-turn-helix domain-containing protein [Edaphobacter sp.]